MMALVITVSLFTLFNGLTPAAALAPDILELLFPSKVRTLPAYAPWSIPEYNGIPAQEPLPDSFDIFKIGHVTGGYH